MVRRNGLSIRGSSVGMARRNGFPLTVRGSSVGRSGVDKDLLKGAAGRNGFVEIT